MPEIEANLENGKNLWSNLLQEVKEKSSKTASLPKSLLVLGNEGSGKSSLIARLQKLDPKHGVGLEFDYIEVKDEFTDENKKLNVWISSGDTYHTNLLKYALNENNFGYTCCLITVSLSEPWNLLDSLEEWLNILKMHINRLKLKSEDEKFFKDSLIYQFQEYSEPDLSNATLLVGKRRDTDYNYLHPSVAEDSDKVLIPLEDGVFVKNLGIPIIVIITKTDNIFALEQDYEYNDDKFDFIQMHLRKICLKYGAALCYTSLKDDRNCDLLLNYILHRCYGFSMKYNASVIEKDAIFIPSGWDSNKKIEILSENLFDDIRKQSYSSLITKPLSIVRAHAQNRLTEPEVAEDEQIFLMRQQALIQRLKSTGSADGNIKDIPRTSTSMTSSSSNRRGKNSPSISSSAGGVGTGSQQSNEGVLANFFSSLLNKRGTTAGSPLPSQQTSVIESPRGEDSISETDDYQKDDISNSLSSNADSTQQRIIEVKESPNQGKVVTPCNVNKIEITNKLVEDSDITNVNFQNSVETLAEVNADEVEANFNDNAVDNYNSKCNFKTTLESENVLDYELDKLKMEKEKDSNFNNNASMAPIKEEVISLKVSSTVESSDILKVENINDEMEDTGSEQIENLDKVDKKATKEIERVTSIFEDDFVHNIVDERKDSEEVENKPILDVENIENDNSQRHADYSGDVQGDNNLKIHSDEKLEDVKESEIEETGEIEFYETKSTDPESEDIKSNDKVTSKQIEEIQDVENVNKDEIIEQIDDNMKIVDDPEKDSTEILKKENQSNITSEDKAKIKVSQNEENAKVDSSATESRELIENNENVVQQQLIINSEDDLDKVTDIPTNEIQDVENMGKNSEIEQFDQFGEITHELEENVKNAELSDNSTEEIANVENIKETQSEESEIEHHEDHTITEVIKSKGTKQEKENIPIDGTITIDDSQMESTGEKESAERNYTDVSNESTDRNLPMNNGISLTDNNTALVDNTELCDQTNEQITLSQ